MKNTKLTYFVFVLSKYHLGNIVQINCIILFSEVELKDASLSCLSL